CSSDLDIELRDHFRSGSLSSHLAVEQSVIAIRVIACLMRIGPIDLSVRPQILAGIHIERLCLIRMGQIEEAQPLFLGDFSLMCRNRRRWIDRLVAREYAAPEEVFGGRIESKLTISIEKSL